MIPNYDIIRMIWQNLTYIGYAAALLATVWLANFLLELYYSRIVIKKCGTVADCLSGVIRFLAVCAGVTLLTVAISAFPPFLSAVGLKMPDEYVEAMSVLAIVALFARSIYEYAACAVKKLDRILDDGLEDFNPETEDNEQTV